MASYTGVLVLVNQIRWYLPQTAEMQGGICSSPQRYYILCILYLYSIYYTVYYSILSTTLLIRYYASVFLCTTQASQMRQWGGRVISMEVGLPHQHSAGSQKVLGSLPFWVPQKFLSVVRQGVRRGPQF